MPETRDRELPYWGLITIMELPVKLTVIVVLPDPAPMMEMPILLGTVTPLVQVQEPDGMLMMSPSTAACVGPLMTAFTAL
jgi:hypothetical protein